MTVSMETMETRSRPRSSSNARILSSNGTRICSVKVHPYTSPDNNDTNQDGSCLIQKWLQPFFVSLYILGLAHGRGMCGKPSGKQTAVFVYTLIVNVLLWGNCVRLLTLFQNLTFNFDWVMIAKLTVLSYNAHCALSASIVFTTFTKPSYLNTYIKQWNENFLAAYDDIESYHKSVRKGVIVITASCWFLFLGTLLATFYAFLFTPLYDMALVPFTADNDHVMLIKSCIFFLFTLRTSASGVFAHGMVILFSWKVSKMCDFHRQRFVRAVDKNGKFTGNLEDYRRKHHDISRLIETCDRFMSMHNTETFILMIALVCLVMYGLIYYPETRATPIIAAMSLWYLITFTSYLAIVCISAAYVNSKAHSLYEDLHSLNLEGESAELIGQVSVFLNRLSATPIGFSALKMFVIDRPTILTILGVLLSYVIVMLQFKPEQNQSLMCDNNQTLS